MEKVNAYVDDGIYIGDEYIEPDKIPKGSVARLHCKVWKHLLVRKDGELTIPVVSAPGESKVTPSDLFDALDDKHSPNVFCNREHPAKKWSIVALFVIIGVAFFFLFIMWAANLGP